MGEELPDECIPNRFGFRKEQDSGHKAIDAVYHKGALSPGFQFGGKKRPGGRGIGAFHGHRRKSGRFIENRHGIVFVKHHDLP
jgi:hypothetical protein